MKSYVLGFLFNSTEFVWLIKKNRPEWQCGKLNGIGGKIEPNEKAVDAMSRECKEETGLIIDNWKWFCTLTDDREYEVYCYYNYSDRIGMSMTDEQVGKYNINCLPENIIPNLRWLIPMAVSFNYGETAFRFSVKEIQKVDLE